jgi:predicted permease
LADWTSEIRALLEGLELDPARQLEIADELGQHLSDRCEELGREGLTLEEARRTALAEARDGGLMAELRRLKQPARLAVPGVDEPGGWLSGLGKDLLFGARLLRLNPAFATAAILSLALGIGANTAIFRLLDAVRLRSLPVADPGRLAGIRIVDNPYGRTGDFTGNFPQLTFALWQEIRAQQKPFESFAVWGMDELNLSPGGEAREAESLWVNGGFFAALGVRPALGRLLQESDDRPGCGFSGAVLSDSFWHQNFAGDPAVVGRKVVLEGHPFEVIGVTAPSFFGVEVGRHFDVALPLCAEPLLHPERKKVPNREAWWLAAIGRLRPGWSVQRASAQLAAASPSIFEATLPGDYDAVDAKHYLGFKLGARPASCGLSELQQRYETPLWMLLGTSGLVLLIACANLANLIVTRASGRQREMAIRLALGASPGRLLRQLICENVLLAALGGICALALSQVLSRALISFLSTRSEQWNVNLALDWRVVAFAAGAAMITCLLFGAAPAIQAARTSPGEAIKASPRGATAGRQGMSLRRVLVVTQVALALVLLVGALLFARTLRNLGTAEAGFRRDQILIVELDLSPLALPSERRLGFKAEVLARLRSVPSVASAASAMIVPVSGRGWNENVGIPDTNVQRRIANFNRVSPDYFRTMGTPLLAGRDFGPEDSLSSPRVAVVTETFVRKFFESGNPVGKALAVVQEGGRPDQIYQIVGLVKDTKYGDLREDFTPIVFTAEAQDEDPRLQQRLVLRSSSDLSGLAAAVRRSLEDVNPAIAFRFNVFETMVREGLLKERLMATLSGFFGLLAALLAMIGLYGVISYTVARRRNEIGVRMALGAGRRDVLTMILKEAAVLLAIGLAFGIVMSLAGGQAARTMLYGLRPGDPLVLAGAVAALSAVTLAASFLPARRAASLDPMNALRDE